jgi:5'-nucleotidase
MPHILVTNDDGVFAPSLLVLSQEMRKLGKVTILAPERNWSACGHMKSLNNPLRVWEVQLADGSPALASDGTPSDCVALVMLGLLDEPVDLVISGINPSPNVGDDMTYSGTVMAAMEAVIWGVPGMAVSLDYASNPGTELDFTPAARYARRVAGTLLENGFPDETVININVPCLPEDQIRGIMSTRTGSRVYRTQLVQRNDPKGYPYYWIGGGIPTGVPEEGTDFGALAAGYVSVTPLGIDMTAKRVVDELREVDWNF